MQKPLDIGKNIIVQTTFENMVMGFVVCGMILYTGWIIWQMVKGYKEKGDD